MSNGNRKTVLLYGLNTPGHRNTLLAIADKLKEDHGYRTVFLTVGPCSDNSITKHGHDHYAVEEKSYLEEYEEDRREPLVEKNQSRRKIKLKGYLKYEHIFRTAIGSPSDNPTDKFIKAIPQLAKLSVAELLENHDNMTKAVKEIKPDLIIIDHAFIPPALMKGIPWAKVWSPNPIDKTIATHESGLKPPQWAGFRLLDKERRRRLQQENPAEWEAMLESWRSAQAKMVKVFNEVDFGALNELYLREGLTPIAKGQYGHDSPHINFYLFPKEIDYDQDDDLFQYPPRWFRLDSQLRKSLSELDPEAFKYWTEKLKQGMEGKKEMIYFSLGSLASGDYELMKKYVDILSQDQDRLYVVSKGPNGDKYELDSRNMIGGNYIPQTWFLERANLAIVHGGNNSIFECLYYGVPSIVLPVFADQNDNAQRIEDMGLGRQFPVHECNAETLLAAVNELVADTKLSEKVAEIGKKIRARDTATKMSRLLKKLLEEKQLDQSFIDQCRDNELDKIQF